MQPKALSAGKGRGVPPRKGSALDTERIRAYLLTLPHAVETVQFGGLVFWVGDKAIGGKMFAWMRLEQNESRTRVISFAAGPERYAELLEIDGILPAP